VLTTDRFGTANGAYYFNGTNAQITIPSSPSLASPTNKITMCAWILLNGNSKVGGAFWPLLMKSNTTDNAFMYRLSGDLSGFGAAFNDWGTQLGSAYAFALNTWTFVAITYDGVNERQYVNGVLNGTQPRTLTMVADTRPLVIGGDTPGIYESFWGKIDDVRMGVNYGLNRVRFPAPVPSGSPTSSDDDAFRIGVQSLRNDSLADIGPVRIRCVDEIDPEFDRAPKNVQSRSAILWRTPNSFACEAHGAKPEPADG
jgi:hypothetical protein